MGCRDEVASAFCLYLYKSRNTIAYKTGSGDELNVKTTRCRIGQGRSRQSMASQTVVDGGHRWATGERNRASGEELVCPFTARIHLLPRIAKMKVDGYGAFCRGYV